MAAKRAGTGPGKGRYTTYVPPKSQRRTFFEKLFKGDGSKWEAVVGDSGETPPFVGLDQAEAAMQASKAGNEILRGTATGGIVDGDQNFFPQGVDMKFTGATAEIQAPDFAKGDDDAWKNPGDPANSYVPDITSPGPGKTEGSDKDVDPKISASDLKPAYVPGGPNTGTKNPSTTSGKLYDAQKLGGDFKKGKSGGDV